MQGRVNKKTVAQTGAPADVAVVLQDVQQTRHLRKDQHSVAALLQLRQLERTPREGEWLNEGGAARKKG